MCYKLLVVAELVKNSKTYGQILTTVNNTPQVQAIKFD